MPLSSLHLGYLLVPASGIAAAASLIAALLLASRTAPLAGLPADGLWSAGVFAVVTAFLASRLLLVAMNLGAFLRYPLLVLTVPSLSATGLLITAVATAIYLRLHRLEILRVLDAWSPPAALLWAALALGHFVEGTDPGLPSRLPWAVRSGPGSLPGHPVALYAAVVALALTAALWRTLVTDRFADRPGATGALALVLAGVAEFFLSFFREPLLPAFAPTPLIEPQQWIALGMIAAGGLISFTRTRSTRHPEPHAV